jgi:hypothetical protein
MVPHQDNILEVARIGMAPIGSHLGLSHLYRTAAPVMEDQGIGHFLQHVIHMIPRKSLPVCVILRCSLITLHQTQFR